jgi:hypothetical protein
LIIATNILAHSSMIKKKNHYYDQKRKKTKNIDQ